MSLYCPHSFLFRRQKNLYQIHLSKRVSAITGIYIELVCDDSYERPSASGAHIKTGMGVNWGKRVIRVLLGQKGKLIRGALATVLSASPDMTVVAELDHGDEADRTVTREAVDIAILDAKLPGATTVNELCERLIRQCGVLILTDPDCGDGACFSLARHVPRVGFIATESSPATLIESVLRAARGEPVFDTKLTMAALNARHNPLTGRERDILCLAARGLRSIDIAQQLYISNGTVRNHLSRILTKTDCRTRIAAIRLAQEKGWI